jgi:hypothetical protein
MRRTHIGLLTLALGVGIACDDVKKAEAPEDEMTALRTEITALRTEVVALRKAIEALDPARAGGGEAETAAAERTGDAEPAAEAEPAEDKPRPAKKKSSGSSGGGGKKDEVRMPGDG